MDAVLITPCICQYLYVDALNENCSLFRVILIYKDQEDPKLIIGSDQMKSETIIKSLKSNPIVHLIRISNCYRYPHFPIPISLNLLSHFSYSTSQQIPFSHSTSQQIPLLRFLIFLSFSHQQIWISNCQHYLH